MELIDKCRELIQVKDVAILFDTRLIVKASPHKELLRAYGCRINSIDNSISLKVEYSGNSWAKINDDNSVNSKMILQTLYQRLITSKIL